MTKVWILSYYKVLIKNKGLGNNLKINKQQKNLLYAVKMKNNLIVFYFKVANEIIKN